MNEKPTDTVTDDVIWGVGGPNGIAAFLNIKPARAYYLISIKAIGSAIQSAISACV